MHQTVLVVDAMTGQDAVNVAKTFDERIGIDGVILTKLDGDTRGGAALSIRAVTGKPIFYAGMGEKLSDLEQFYPSVGVLSQQKPTEYDYSGAPEFDTINPYGTLHAISYKFINEWIRGI